MSCFNVSSSKWDSHNAQKFPKFWTWIGIKALASLAYQEYGTMTSSPT
jgi:hypothetical protein